MSSLSIQERREGNHIIVSLSGSANLASEPLLDRETTRMAAARPALLVLELSGLELITSLAIGQLVALAHSIRRHGGDVVLAGVPELIIQVLDRTRLRTFFRTFDSVESALASSQA
jgi:anti-anti-sigma factor